MRRQKWPATSEVLSHVESENGKQCRNDFHASIEKSNRFIDWKIAGRFARSLARFTGDSEPGLDRAQGSGLEIASISVNHVEMESTQKLLSRNNGSRGIFSFGLPPRTFFSSIVQRFRRNCLGNMLDDDSLDCLSFAELVYRRHSPINANRRFSFLSN